jgi:hypothetical protein
MAATKSTRYPAAKMATAESVWIIVTGKLIESSLPGNLAMHAEPGQYRKALKLDRLPMYAFFEGDILLRLHGNPLSHQVDKANPLP